MRSFLLFFVCIFSSLFSCFASSASGGTNSLRLNISLEKGEIQKGEITIVHYELDGSTHDLLGASVSLQGIKLESNKGYELLSPDSSTNYVFQVLKYNKPIFSKSFTVYVRNEGKILALDPSTSENIQSDELLAETDKSHSKKLIKKGRPKSLRLTVDLDRAEISRGDSASLHYRLDGKARHLNGAYILFNGAKLNDARGVITLKSDSSIQYILEVRKNDALLIKKQLALNIVEENLTKTPTSVSNNKSTPQGYVAKNKTSNYTSNYSAATAEATQTSLNKESDGRFNIIGGGKYLTYGGNSNSSSSHFIVQVGDEIASNDPSLKNLHYLKAQEQLEVPYDNGSSVAENVFYFENIRIVQRLTPVDSLLNPIPKNTWGSVYKIEYELENYSLQNKVINFLTLSDFMLDQNDNPRAYINHTKLVNSWTCDKNNMPESIQLRLNNSNTKIQARCILKNANINGPDSLSYGNWQSLSRLTHLGKHNNQEVVDNALLLKWSNLLIEAQSKKTISYAYGFNGSGKVDLELIDANVPSTESIVYFTMGASQISAKTWRNERKTLLRIKPKLAHIELIGHTDAMGNAVNNIRLSKLRCMGIKLLMMAEGVNKNLISIKPMGEEFADQSGLFRKKGKREDRKVVIHYFLQQTATQE